MKQLLLLISSILSLIILSLPASAQTLPTVTLDHEGKLTVFEGSSSFEDAVKAAVSDDILYLSPGKFGLVGKQFDIDSSKRIYFVGSGYDSHILYNLVYGFKESPEVNHTTFEGLMIEKLSLGGVNNCYAIDVSIKNCRFHTLDVSSYFKNVQIESSYIGTFSANVSGPYIAVYNSKIVACGGGYDRDKYYNCNIGEFTNVSGFYQSCIIGSTTSSNSGRGIFENCVIPSGFTAISLRDTYEVESSILGDNLESTVDLVQSGYLGTDGTEVGIYGGQWNHFSENPTLPTVDSKNSSVEYDPTSNQLKVNIQLLPE